jgi:excisionase family DNA binding protein
MATETIPSTNGVAYSPLDVLTLAEAAAYLRVAEEVVRSEADAGRLVGRRVGDEWRFVREAVAAWLRTPQPAATPLAAWTPEREAEAEAEIAAIYAQRKVLGTVGDRHPDEDGE